MRVGSSVIPLTAVATIAIATKPGNQRESEAVQGAAADAILLS